MRFSFAAALALATAVFAQTPGFDVISKPGNFEKVPAGTKYTIVWDPKPEHTGTVSLSLIGGKDQKSLQALGPIGKADNQDGKFEWDVSKTLGKEAIYGIQITWDEDTTIFQYSFPFHVSADGAAAGSDAPSSTPGSNSTATKTSILITSTPIGNLSTSSTSRLTTVVSSTSTSNPTRTTGASASTSTAGAAPANVGGTIALFGGLAMAVFAL